MLATSFFHFSSSTLPLGGIVVNIVFEKSTVICHAPLCPRRKAGRRLDQTDDQNFKQVKQSLLFLHRTDLRPSREFGSPRNACFKNRLMAMKEQVKSKLAKLLPQAESQSNQVFLFHLTSYFCEKQTQEGNRISNPIYVIVALLSNLCTEWVEKSRIVQFGPEQKRVS